MHSSDIRTYIKIKTIATASKLAEAWNHDFRVHTPPNANPEYTQWNRTLKPLPKGETISDAWQRVAGKATRRGDAVYATSFKVHLPKLWVDQRMSKEIDEFADSTTEFLQKMWGNRLLCGAMHRDELGPHLHYLLVPLDLVSNRVAQRRLLDETGIRELNKAYHAEVLNGFGIGRSFVGSRPSYKDIKSFDKAVQTPVTLIAILPDDIQEPGLLLTSSAKADYRKQVSDDVTRIANERNADVAMKANAVGLYQAKVTDSEKTIRAKQNFIEKQEATHAGKIIVLQKLLAAEKADAESYRQQAATMVDPSELLMDIGYRPQISGNAAVYCGVGDTDTIVVRHHEAFGWGGKCDSKVPIPTMDLLILATGWTVARCYAHLLEHFPEKALAVMINYVRAQARVVPAAPQINVNIDPTKWKSTAARVPEIYFNPAALARSYHEAKVASDDRGHLLFLLMDDTKQIGGFLAYSPEDPSTPLRECGGGAGYAFAMGSPRAPIRIICENPWQVINLQEQSPPGTVYGFCGTEAEPPVGLLKSIPDGIKLMRYGFPEDEKAFVKLTEKLGEFKLPALAAYDPTVAYWSATDLPLTSKDSTFGHENGRTERDTDEPDNSIAI